MTTAIKELTTGTIKVLPAKTTVSESEIVNLNDKYETINLGVKSRDSEFTYFNLILPSYTQIYEIVGILDDYTEKVVKDPIFTITGCDEIVRLNDDMGIYPGDYTIKIASNKENIVGLRLKIIYEQISNFMISQIIFNLYQSLGFEPSQIMKFNYQTKNRSVPFYRKLINESNRNKEQYMNKIDELEKNIKEILTKKNTEENVYKSILEIKDVLPEIKLKLEKLENLDAVKSKVESLDDIKLKLEKLENLDSVKSLIETKIQEIKMLFEFINTNVTSLHSQIDKMSVNYNTIISDIGKLNVILKTDFQAQKSENINKIIDLININIQDVNKNSSKIIYFQNEIGKLTSKINSTLNKYIDKRKEIDMILINQISELLSIMNLYTEKKPEYLDYQKNNNIINELNSISEKLDNTVLVRDITELVKEKDIILNKLTEAENYIDKLEKQQKKQKN